MHNEQNNDPEQLNIVKKDVSKFNHLIGLPIAKLNSVPRLRASGLTSLISEVNSFSVQSSLQKGILTISLFKNNRTENVLL